MLAVSGYVRYDANMCSGPGRPDNPTTTEGPLDAASLLATLRATPTSELEASFRELDTLENATGAYKLLVLSVLDERDVGREDGTLDTIGWVTWTARVTKGRARALVETARALPDRPAISTAALVGRLSTEQLAAVVQVATPDTDAAWAADAPGWTATSLLAAARNHKTVTGEEAVERDRERKVGYRWDETRGELRFWGRVPDADGAGVVAAFERGADKMGPDEHGQWKPYPVRCADVFINALTAEAPDASEAGRAGLMVHTPEASLHADSDEPGAYLDTGETGIPIANETVRRLACDAIRRTVLEDSRGVPLKLGRRTRTVPIYLFHLLKHRDRHCRAPGCRRTIGLHAHHLVHWADGGETNLENLVLLCSRHHHLVHEEHWQICGRPNQPETLRFRPPEARPVTPYQPAAAGRPGPRTIPRLHQLTRRVTDPWGDRGRARR